ncbi:MAG: hypothetical protein A2265_12120 [Bacteroidetes bacterium RIFOXYA12_FULL_33_9]|nr:MAG: hypothetical protein A2265_12120 [Bacteroidetes bacterium RIFOXYA12_FULL_33_9]
MKNKILYISLITFSAFLPLIVWTIELKANNMSFSFFNLWNLHLMEPAIFLLEFFVIGTIITFYVANKEFAKAITAFTQKTKQKDEIIKRNIKYALQIGRGDYSTNSDEQETDILGKSLTIMKQNLLRASEKEKELNWISKGRDMVSDILRLHNDLEKLTYEVLVNVINYGGFIQGAFYIYEEDKNILKNYATYAYNRKKYVSQEFKLGYGLIGQCAYEKDLIYRTEVPEEYATITSGILGDKKPGSILMVPLITDEKLYGVIELACIDNKMSQTTIDFVKELSDIIARTIFNLKINQKTKNLLDEARLMTEELKRNEELLTKNADDMKAAQEKLEEVNVNLEKKVQEVEQSQVRQQTLLLNASEVISIIDENGIVLYESPSVKSILGYDANEIIGKNAFGRMSSNEANKVKESFETLLKKPWETIVVEFKYIKGGNEEIWLETIGRNLINNPAIGGVLFNTRDITQRKIAEFEQRMRGQMQALSENSPDMILRLNLEGKFYYANSIVKKYIDLDIEAIIGNSLNDVEIDKNLVVFFSGIIEYIKSNNEKFESEFEFETVLGERVFLFNAIPEYDENTVLETILVVAHDITDRKHIENEIKDKNFKITESINYAYRIQSSILPNTDMLRHYFPESIILYKPKDVVSGDFPWIFKKGDNLFVAAVDCTGHGVPGALLSFIGYFILNNIVDHDRDISASEVLDLLHTKVRHTLKQDEEGSEARDGMDIALCKINFNKKELQYAGAHRPLYYISDSVLTEYKGDRKAIGGVVFKNKIEKNFTNYTVNYKENDRIYFFSDGFPDQVGGDDNKTKYSTRQLREFIEASTENMEEFGKEVNQEFLDWKKDNKQIDDILLFGIKLKH